jgi:lauroyl/myristoyl acyltransferase
MTIGQRVVLAAYRVASAVTGALPAWFAQWLPKPLGWILARVLRSNATMLRSHIRRVRPDADGIELRAAVTAGFESYVRYYVESFRLPKRSAEQVSAGFRVTGYEYVENALRLGSGVILALPHLGGWEWAGFWLTKVKGLRISVVVEALEPQELFDFFADLRGELGMNVIAADASAATQIAAALSRNEVVCLLSDRDVTGGGLPVSFFDEITNLPGGPALLALRSGAPILPTAVYFEPGGMHFGVVKEPLDLSRSGNRLRADMARVTQDLAYGLEDLIRHAPDQWHLLQPNWPSDPGWAGTHQSGESSAAG